jgi:predicted DNA-binding ribbon-helix-helix protein
LNFARDPAEAAMTVPKKRSVTIKGHRTSITLEDAFWRALREVSEAEGRSIPLIIGEIDRARGKSSLSAAIRVYLLEYFKRRAATAPPYAERP